MKMFNENKEEFLSDKTYVAMKQSVPDIERITGGKVLFGRIAGSKAQGLSSKASDNDWHIFISGGEEYRQEQIEKEGNKNLRGGKIVDYLIQLDGETVVVDSDIIFWEKVKEDLDSRLARTDIMYPTCLNYSKEEEKKHSLEELKTVRYRNDYGLLMFHLLILSDSMWVNSEYKDFSPSELYRLVRTIDMLDMYHVRAYGNVQNYIKGKDDVLVRKYMYTLMHLESMKWILTKGTKPPMDFRTLIAGNLHNSITLEHINRAYDLNKNATEYKTKYKEAMDPVLNEYIENLLEEVTIGMKSYSKTETYEDIIRNTETERLPRIYY